MAIESAVRPAENFYPIGVKLKGKRVLIYGGNKSALKQVSRLVDFGATVDIVSQHMAAELQDVAVTYGDRVNLHKRKFSDDDVEALEKGIYSLVFACHHDREENKRVMETAKQSRVLGYALDDAEFSDFVVPSLIKRGNLKIGVSTDAISAPLERALVSRIEAIFVSEIDNYTLFLSSMRELAAKAASDKDLSNPAVFRALMHDLSESEEILLALQRKNFEEANRLAQQIVDEAKAESVGHPQPARAE